MAGAMMRMRVRDWLHRLSAMVGYVAMRLVRFYCPYRSTCAVAKCPNTISQEHHSSHHR